MRNPALVAAFVTVAALAAPGTARDRNQIPAATPAGEPLSCIPLTRIGSTHVRSNSVIDFEMRDRKVYRVTLPFECPGLGFEERFSYATSLSQLCSTDIITVLYAAGPQAGASCGLAKFQPVTLDAKPRR